MVHAKYYASYPKQPCVVHEANMWCPCCMMSFVLESSTKFSQVVIYKSTCLENYIPTVMPPLNHISPPSMVATFLTTHLMAVLQPSRYSVFHDGDTPIQLGLP